MATTKKQLLIITFILTTISTTTFAVRPFITDDAAVIGHRLFQLETWALIDNSAGEYWMMWAYGPTKRLEVAIGSIFGYDKSRTGRPEFTFATPLLEAKYLFREYETGKFPGIALAVGTFLPTGRGDFVAS